MDRRQRRHLGRRRVARQAGIPPYVVAVWCLATLIGGAVLLLDAHFHMDLDSSSVEASSTFSFFRSVTTVRLVDPLFEDQEPTRRETEYAVALASIPSALDEVRRREPAGPERARIERALAQGRIDLRRLIRAGTAYFALVCAAPAIGLLVLLWRKASTTFRHTLLLAGALVPLGALEYFHYAVSESVSRARTSQMLDDLALETAPVTWWARFAWGMLAAAVIVSWVRQPRVRPVTPTDPEVFK